MANSSVSPTPPTNEPDHTGHSTDSHHLDHFHNALSSTTPNAHWQPDMLGPDYESMSFALGTDPDGETDIYTTLVRYTPSVQGAKATRVFKKPKPLKAPRPGTTILPLMVTINPPSSLSMGCQIIFSRPMSLSFSPTKGMLFMPSTCVNAGDHTDLANHGITSPVSPNISLTSPR